MKSFAALALIAVSITMVHADLSIGFPASSVGPPGLSIIGSSTVSATPPTSTTCYSDYIQSHDGLNPWSGVQMEACTLLTSSCAEEAMNTTYIWHKTSCVAAATCNGPTFVYNQAKCLNDGIADTRAATPDLSTNIYSDIVGGCSTCSMTQQNYIDFFYSALSAINSTQWPSSVDVVIDNQWEPIDAWAATGATIPYQNLDDFLHYAPY